MSGQPGRYQRSTSGLVGALLVTLLVIAAYIGFRALNRDELEVRPEPIDLADAVLLGREAGVNPIYPEPLPRGWIATSVDTGTVDEPAWGLGLHTDDGDFVGIRREDTSLDALISTFVDEGAERGDTVRLASPVAQRWQTWTDDGGDTAYVARVGEDWLLVYGSARTSDLREVVESLRQQVSRPSPA